MLKYVVFPKVILLVLVYKIYIECSMYLHQELVGNRKGFKGIMAISINPLPFRIPLAKQSEYTKPLLHLFLLLLLSL